MEISINETLEQTMRRNSVKRFARDEPTFKLSSPLILAKLPANGKSVAASKLKLSASSPFNFYANKGLASQ